MKQICRSRKLLREISSHPDALRALTCKKQCDFFRHTRLANRVQSRARAKLLGRAHRILARVSRRREVQDQSTSRPVAHAPEIALARELPLASVNQSNSMRFTVREIESPDPVTRVAAVEAALREPADADIGEKMVLNMGPSHPATHGVLRLVLELDGEIITKATPDIGFLHRGDEKIAENMQYNQFVPYTDRLDYLAPLSNNVAYALAVEQLMDWDIPPRGKAIRTICCETSRISSHLLGIGAMALDLGAMTVFLYTFTEREKLYNLFELLTGARFTTSYTRVGGQIRDLPERFIP